jgi:hypothetical protein
METFKTIGLVLLFIIFFITGGIFLLVKGVENTFLQASFYEKAVDEAEISPLLVNELLDGVEQRAAPRLEGLPGDSGQVLRNSLREAFSESLDEEWAEETFLTVVEDGLAYVKGEQEKLTAVIDLEEKKNMIEDSIENQIKTEVNAEIEEQVRQRDVPPGSEDRVKSQVASQINSEINIAVTRVMNETPDQVVLADVFARHPNSEQIKAGVLEFQELRDRFNTYSYPVLVALALLIFILAGILSGLKWIGIAMIFSAVAVLVFLFGLERAVPAFLNDIGLEKSYKEVSMLLDPFTVRMKNMAMYYSLAGLIALLLGFFIKKPGKKKKVVDSEDN